MHSSERLKGIDVFVCVADTGSFTGAGERLHLTTSAVSKAIARLEKRLQVRLFDRTTAIGDIEGQATAVIAGHGIAQLPLWLVREHLKSGRLVQVLPGLEAEGLPMNIAWLRSREKLPKVKTLVEHLKSTLSPAGHNCGAE
ncbi:LysR family transcriptional regulator [Pantoea sp. MBD-2R]|uniref:LysR family transcriptional regulator n=1 Tax=Pantoea sp. MBD-2R TaxID=3141540 RepID=UPI0031840DCB